MNRWLYSGLLFFLAIGVLLIFGGNLTAWAGDPKVPYKPDELIVQYRNVNHNLITQWEAKEGLQPRWRDSARHLAVVRLPSGLDVPTALKRLAASPLLVRAEPNYKIEWNQLENTPPLPDDPLFTTQWSLYNDGSLGKLADADVDAPEGWAALAGQELAEEVVAVLDDGIDYTHEDLQDILWRNSVEIPDDGIDNDLNGYVDDVTGWDFGDGDNDPYPVGDGAYNSHGTMVSGLIFAHTDNSLGIAGLAPNARLMALKVRDAADNGYVSYAIEAVYYAIDNGAKIINMSFSARTFIQAFYDALKEASAAGLLSIASAGNDSRDLASYEFGMSPQTFDLPNLLIVAASTEQDDKATFSSYGTLVDVSAPGVNITTTSTLSTRYTQTSGTSFSSPIVAGLAALLWGAAPEDHAGMISGRLRFGVDPLQLSSNRYAGLMGSGRVSLIRALEVTPEPMFRFDASRLDDGACSACNGNGISEPGETVTLYLTLTDEWQPVQNIRASLSLDSPEFTIVTGEDNETGLMTDEAREFRFSLHHSGSNIPLNFTGQLLLSDGQSFQQQLAVSVKNDLMANLQVRIDAANPGDLIVAPSGIYHGSLMIQNKQITLRGADLASTIFQGKTDDRKDVSLSVFSSEVTVENITFRAGNDSIDCTSSQMIIRNNDFFASLDYSVNIGGGCQAEVAYNRFIDNRVGIIFFDETLDKLTHHNIFVGGEMGIGVYGKGGRIFQNTFYHNSSYGVLWYLSRDDITPLETLVSNNIFAQVSASGVEFTLVGRTELPDNMTLIAANSFFREDGALADFAGHFPSKYIGPGNIAVDPLFVEASQGDFHLRSTSRAIDAGAPGTLDLDGSMADLGRYGQTNESTRFSETGLPIITIWQEDIGSVAAGQEVRLNPSGEDFEGYAWLQLFGTAVALSDPAAKSPTFVAPTVSSSETLTFQLVVTQGGKSSRPRTLRIGLSGSGRPCGVVNQTGPTTSDHGFISLFLMWLGGMILPCGFQRRKR